MILACFFTCLTSLDEAEKDETGCGGDAGGGGNGDGSSGGGDGGGGGNESDDGSGGLATQALGTLILMEAVLL